MLPGLPPVTVGWWTPLGSLARLLPTAASISVVSLLEAISIARAIAFRHNDAISPRQELFGEACRLAPSLAVTTSAEGP